MTTLLSESARTYTDTCQALFRPTSLAKNLAPYRRGKRPHNLATSKIGQKYTKNTENPKFFGIFWKPGQGGVKSPPTLWRSVRFDPPIPASDFCHIFAPPILRVAVPSYFVGGQVFPKRHLLRNLQGHFQPTFLELSLLSFWKVTEFSPDSSEL